MNTYINMGLECSQLELVLIWKRWKRSYFFVKLGHGGIKTMLGFYFAMLFSMLAIMF